MECNKDEALRAKEIADRKITEKDYVGAKKFALKAQNLFPQLDGLSQMLTTIDVYISSENKIVGEADWYGILGVVPGADDEAIRRQYRKLALMLHPDKNKSAGAEGAFKMVSEAWNLLSDKAKRLAYNLKKGSMGSYQQSFTSQSGVSSQVPSANGFHKSHKNTTSNVRPRSNSTRADPNTFSSPPNKKAATFWTICNRCKTQYEYLRVYLHQTLLCPNCHTAFMALEKAPPPSVVKSSNWSSGQQNQNSRYHVANKNTSNNVSFQWGHSSKMSGVNASNPSSSTSAQAASVIQRAHEKVLGDAERAFKKRRPEDSSQNGFVANQQGSGAGFVRPSESGKSYSEVAGIYGYSGLYCKPKSERELLSFEVRNMLLGKAQITIRMKLKDWIPASKTRENESMKKRNMISIDDTTAVQDKKSSQRFFGNDSIEETLVPVTINVPDPDFHNFDLNRTESSFGDDQVWAAYDNDDGMPRYYARIHNVISLKPFKMKISWLNSRTNTELGPIDWIGSGFTKTCGDFRAGRHEITETLNAFSHKVHWRKGVRGVIHIFPRKGNVWAVYRNWSPEWNERTPDVVIHKYDMVEVLEDYNEEGVTVNRLTKITDFKTVYRKSTDPTDIKRIPKEEMFRFSHQVPYYELTGEEASNAPAGCLELDPAATPLELLQGTTEVNEAEPPPEKTKEETLSRSPKLKVDKSGFRYKEVEMVDVGEKVNGDRVVGCCPELN